MPQHAARRAKAKNERTSESDQKKGPHKRQQKDAKGIQLGSPGRFKGLDPWKPWLILARTTVSEVHHVQRDSWHKVGTVFFLRHSLNKVHDYWVSPCPKQSKGPGCAPSLKRLAGVRKSHMSSSWIRTELASSAHINSWAFSIKHHKDGCWRKRRQRRLKRMFDGFCQHAFDILEFLNMLCFCLGQCVWITIQFIAICSISRFTLRPPATETAAKTSNNKRTRSN